MNKQKMMKEKIEQLENMINCINYCIEHYINNFNETKDTKEIESLKNCLNYRLKDIEKYLIFIEVLNEN